jgi:spore coat protein A
MSRRGLLRLGGAAVTGTALSHLLTGCGDGGGGANTSSAGSAGTVLASETSLPEAFRVPLPIPPVLKPVRSDATADYYSIRQKVGRAAILPGRTTEIWGYEGPFPAPPSCPAVGGAPSSPTTTSSRSR